MMKTKNVCIITNLAPWKYGGIETVVRELNTELVKMRYRFTIFCHDKNFSVKKLPYGTIHCIKETIPYFGILLPDFEYALKILGKKFDIIHAHYQTIWYPIFRKFVKKTPYIVTFHGTAQSELNTIPQFLSFDGKMRRRIGAVFEKISAKSADAVVACSKAVKEDLIKLYKIPEEKIRVIYNGVDVKKFRPIDKEKCRKLLKLDKNTFYGLTVMTDPKRKGFDILMDAISLLSRSSLKIKIIVIGQKGENTENVIFYERIPYDKLVYFYNAADFFVYPSLYDGLPLVTLYALACGKPLIVSKNSNVEHIKNGKEGFIIEKPNPILYYEKILLLVQNKNILDSMSKAARETVLKISWKNQATEYKKLYEEVLNKY